MIAVSVFTGIQSEFPSIFDSIKLQSEAEQGCIAEIIKETGNEIEKSELIENEPINNEHEELTNASISNVIIADERESGNL